MQQLFVAAAALLLGAAAGILYDLLRAVRRRLRSQTLTFVSDILFSAAAGLGLFLLGFGAGGSQRIFMPVLGIAGFALYLCFPSRFVLRAFSALFDFAVRIARTLLLPAAICCKKLKKIIIFIKKSFEIRRKEYIIKRNVVRSQRRKKPERRNFPEGNANETQKGRYYY